MYYGNHLNGELSDLSEIIASFNSQEPFRTMIWLHQHFSHLDTISSVCSWIEDTGIASPYSFGGIAPRVYSSEKGGLVPSLCS